MSTNFPTLKNILAELKRKNSITVLEEHCQEKWEVYDLLMDLTNDENFKQAYIDLSFNKSFKKNFIELANQAKKAVSKYFRDKDIDLRAFYVETNNSDKVLNINLINYNRSEPIRISDILQQERDISTLNIYCDKKHDIYAYRKGKERHYEFKEGAYYEMTSTWPVQDKDGKTFTCTMVMNVSNSGITKVLQFNGKDFESPPEEFLELIRQNEELYIQGLSLHDAVKALLEKNKDAPAVINLQNNEHIVINKDEKMKDLENDAKSNPILSFTSNNVSEVNPQQIATQAIATQTEVNSQQLDQKLTKAEQEIRELNEQRNELRYRFDKAEQELEELEKHNSDLQNELGEEKQEIRELNEQKNKLQYRLDEAEQEIRELNELRNNLQHRLEEAKQEFEKHNSDLQNKLGEEKQKNAKLQTELTQKDEKLANMSTELQERAQELEGAYEEKKDLKKKLEVANVKNKKLEDTLQIESEQSERIMIEENERLTNLKYRLDKAEQEFEKHNSDLQNELGEEKQKNAKLQAELTQKNEKLANMSTELQEKIQELESAHEGKKDLEKKLTIANAKNEKLEDKLKQFKKAEEEAEDILNENWKDIQNLKFTILRLDDKYNTNLESYKQEVDQLKQEYEGLKNEVELKDEQIKKYKQQLSQKREETKENQLLTKIKELEECNEHLTEIIGNKALEIERITGERKELKGTVQYLNSQVELLSPVIDQVLVNKKEVFDNNSKMFYQLTEKIDDSEKKSRSLSLDSAFHSDHCNSLLDLISSPSKVCSQSQRGNV
ncbi:hypothetical protein [Wolbachia endosymbiont (group B) of Ablattaria laevigata]|uniref:hypothetical protein n=1 Tax=Wolbachia endosymbiont (group B) of Ablattaria laevigata TaxID=3077915 RepID=UPI00376EB8FE